MELKIDTKIGVLTGIFESDELEPGKDVFVAHFKERSSIIVQADSIVQAIDELLKSLNMMLEIEANAFIKRELDLLNIIREKT